MLVTPILNSAKELPGYWDIYTAKLLECSLNPRFNPGVNLKCSKGLCLAGSLHLITFYSQVKNFSSSLVHIWCRYNPYISLPIGFSVG